MSAFRVKRMRRGPGDHAYSWPQTGSSVPTCPGLVSAGHRLVWFVHYDEMGAEASRAVPKCTALVGHLETARQSGSLGYCSGGTRSQRTATAASSKDRLPWCSLAIHSLELRTGGIARRDNDKGCEIRPAGKPVHAAGTHHPAAMVAPASNPRPMMQPARATLKHPASLVASRPLYDFPFRPCIRSKLQLVHS